MTGEETGDAALFGEFHCLGLAGENGVTVVVLVVEENVVGLGAFFEIFDRLVSSGLVVVVGDGLAFPEGVHVGPDLPGEAGASEGGTKVFAFVTGDGWGTGLHARPDDDGDEALFGVMLLSEGVSIGSDGAPWCVAHGSD